MTWIELVREYFPNVSEDKAEYILWNETGFPSFWRGDPEQSCREQLEDFRKRSQSSLSGNEL